VVNGADGRYSLVADQTPAREYNEKPQLKASYYTYWCGLPMSGRFETALRPGRGFAAWPTSDDLTVVIAGRTIDEFDSMRKNIEATYLETLEIAPAFAERVRSARREERFVGAAVRAYFRKPFGPGWALVGDAAYNKDFITAQGIQDAFRDAELCATAVDEALAGRDSFDRALGEYQARRDEQVLPMYEFTADLAMLAPSPPDLERLLRAVSRSREAMDGFARVAAGVTSPAEFFSDESAERILAAAA
jgi:2-polyprenyl-6-methoxyphenol hydroxylase-like FAD-dependent oxidoreductase